MISLLMMEGIQAYIFSKYDHSDHYRHHLYYVVNYGDAKIDRFFGTAYDPVLIHNIIRKIIPLRRSAHTCPISRTRKTPYFRDINELINIFYMCIEFAFKRGGITLIRNFLHSAEGVKKYVNYYIISGLPATV